MPSNETHVRNKVVADPHGKIVYHQKTADTIINLGHLSKGIYFIHLSAPDRRPQVFKISIIKE